MPRIPFRTASQDFGGQSRSPAGATSDAFSSAQGLVQLGKAVSNLGQAIEDKVERDALVRNQRAIAQGRGQWIQRLEDAKTNAEPGAPDFTKNMLEEFDQWKTQQISSAATARAKEHMTLELDSMRNQILTQSVGFETQSSAKFKATTVRGVFDDNANSVRVHPELLEEVLRQNQNTLDTVNIKGQVRSDLQREQSEAMHFSAMNGRIDKALDNKSRPALEAALNELQNDKRWAKNMSDSGFAQTLGRARQGLSQIKSEDAQYTNDLFKDSIPEITRGIGLDSTVAELRTRIASDITDPVKKKDMDHRLNLAVTTGEFYNQIKTADATEIPKIVQEMAAKVQTPGDFSVDTANVNVIVNEAIRMRNEAMKNDRATFAIEANESLKKDWENASEVFTNPDNVPKGEAGVRIDEYVTAAIAEQTRLGVPENNVHLLPQGYVLHTKGLLDSLIVKPDGPEKAHDTIVQMASAWGKHWPMVKQQLIAEKALTGAQAVVADLTDPRDRGTGNHMMQASAIGKKELSKMIGGDSDYSGIESEVRNTMGELYGTMLLQIGGHQMSSSMNQAVTDLAAYYVTKGDSIGDAVTKASEPFLRKYNYEDTYRVPVQEDIGAVSVGAEVARQNIGSLVPNILLPTSMVEGLPEDIVRADSMKAIQQKGIWVTNGSETGLQLAWSNGTAVMFRNANGALQPVEYTWQQLKEMKNLPSTTPDFSGAAP